MKCRRRKYAFIVMDFEFIQFNRDVVLISGAMSTYRTKARIVKLQGIPLVLAPGGHVTRFNLDHRFALVEHVSRVLRKKPDLCNAVLSELHRSVARRDGSTLRPERIVDYLYHMGQRPVLVLWNGSADVDILNRLRVPVPIVLNLTTFNDDGDTAYYLKLINCATGELIGSRKIGNFRKNGRMLSLSEAHSVCCRAVHRITYVHDPVVDVLYTKCVFNYLLKQEGYGKTLRRAVTRCY